MTRRLIWKQFEDSQDGSLLIDGTWHYMRVGLFMNRPTQAIQANGKFVKMRLAPRFRNHDLDILNPKDDKCLYWNFENVRTWKPPDPTLRMSQIITTTLRNRTGALAKNVLRNNALLKRLKVKP